jgi:hypothetical protein
MTALRRSVLDRLVQSGEPEPRNWYESVRALKSSCQTSNGY